jgi:transposase
VRINKVLKSVLGLNRDVVITGWELTETDDGGSRPKLEVRVRLRNRRRGPCGRCGTLSPRYDQGDGERRWRHIDVGYATCELVADAPRVDCAVHGATVVAFPFARHDTAFTAALEDVVVHDAVVANKQAAADRYGLSWRAVNNACVRLAEEALGRADLLDGLVAVAIDEVKYKRGQRYLTVVCDHVTGKVVWAAKGRSKGTVRAFFAALGGVRAAALQFVSCDGAEWIRSVVAEQAPDAIVTLDTFHLVGWATDAVDEVRRAEWNLLRKSGGAAAAKQFKGLRWLLLRNWGNLTSRQKAVVHDLAKANRRMFRGWQLKEELRHLLTLPLIQARAALDQWLAWASRSKLAPFVKLARTIRHYRASIEATIEWKLTNGIAESNNAAIGRLRSAARGFQDPNAFITMILLDRADLAPDLPWATAS